MHTLPSAIQELNKAYEPFTIVELETAINKMKRKSPGHDTLTIDCFKHLGPGGKHKLLVQAYTNAEVHSIKGSPGDVANVGVFSDNADKTIFEFLESFELGYIDWGNNRQRASKLSNHLSDDLKDKLIIEVITMH